MDKYVPIDLEQVKNGRECVVIGGKNFRTDNRNEAPARFLGVLMSGDTSRACVFATDTVGDGNERIIVQNLVIAGFGGLQVVMKKQKKEYWVNVYNHGDGDVSASSTYPTKHLAEENIMSIYSKQHVTTVKVYEEWEE